MIISHQRITIVNMRKPTHQNVNQQLQWLGSSLGLFGIRDKDKSCFRLFLELLKAAKMNTPLKSDDLATRLGLSRGTVVHHLTKLIEAGIVVPAENKYILRVDTLQELIDELEKDLQRTLNDLKEVAEEVDRYLGM